jgi:cold shock CspA family protein
MQGTVFRYDSLTRGGAVLLDDGTELSFAADAIDGTRLRLLRPGQRVRVDVAEVDGHRRVVGVQIFTVA